MSEFMLTVEFTARELELLAHSEIFKNILRSKGIELPIKEGDTDTKPVGFYSKVVERVVMNAYNHKETGLKKIGAVKELWTYSHANPQVMISAGYSGALKLDDACKIAVNILRKNGVQVTVNGKTS